MAAERTFGLLTLDLDDTLWPCTPTLERAEARLYAWLTGADRAAADGGLYPAGLEPPSSSGDEESVRHRP